MADKKISALTEKTTPVAADLLALVDTEAVPDETKKITLSNLAKVHAALTTGVHGVGALHAAGFHAAGQAVNKIIWKDTDERALLDENRTITLAYTDLDLTAYTSANAKFAILGLELHVASYTDGRIMVRIRKNGTTPTCTPELELQNPSNTAMSPKYFVLVALDSEQIIEYTIILTGTAQVDTVIYVLGYIE